MAVNKTKHKSNVVNDKFDILILIIHTFVDADVCGDHRYVGNTSNMNVCIKITLEKMFYVLSSK